MKRYKMLFMTAAFLLAGVGTAAASAGPGVQMQSMDAAAENTEGTDYLRQLYDFKIKVGGEELQIPVSYGELVNRGWVMTTFSEEYQNTLMVKNFEYVLLDFVKGNVVMSARMFNDQNTDRQLKDLEAAEISFSLSQMKGAIPDIVLPGNIVLGKSTEADIKSAYGEPFISNVRESSAALIYWLSDDQSVSFYHNNDADKVINLIKISNEGEQNRKAMEYINSIQPSDLALAYVAPSALGSDIASSTYEFEGDVYQFPTPLTAFSDKGWEIESGVPSAYYLDPGKETSVTIQRNGIIHRVTVVNKGTERAPIHNCFTARAYSDSLPNGIKRGSTRSDVLKALEGVDYIINKERGSDLYIVKTADQKYEVKIWVYDNDEKVSDLTICYPEIKIQ